RLPIHLAPRAPSRRNAGRRDAARARSVRPVARTGEPTRAAHALDARKSRAGNVSELGVHRGLWFALELDGRGGARAIDGDALVQAQPTWIHLDPRAPETIGWLREHAGLSDTELERLLADDRRTRLEPFREDCFVLALRGLAPEVDGDPRELPLARFWIQPGRLISFA